MKADLITVGNELLDGTTLNTNAKWLCDRLFRAGIPVARIVTVGDAKEEILSSLEHAVRHSEVVIVTGGLGPTHDDVTKDAVAAFLGVPLVENRELRAHIAAMFQRRGVEMPPVNLEQARVPRGVCLLQNPLGTAPGFRFERDRAVCFVLPGVPAEMKAIAEASVLPFLRKRFRDRLAAVRFRNIRTTGIFESSLFEKLAPVSQIERWVHLAFLPHRFGVDLRLSVQADTEAEAEERLERAAGFILERIGEFVYEVGERSLEQVVADLLFGQKRTVAVAESCTAGLVSHLLTNISGSSAYLLGGVVAYSNEVKQKVLGVSAGTLATRGAVSAETAAEMAEGIKELAGADLGLATTGIAGPTGGTPEKPVGLVFVGYAGPDGTETQRFVFHRERLSNKYRFAYAALNLLRRHLLALKRRDSPPV